MVAKLAVTILVVGAAFAALLVNRQQRIDAVAEISRAQLRMTQHDRTINRLHAAVAQAIQPAELQRLAFGMPIEWQQIPYRFDPLQPAGVERAAATVQKDNRIGRDARQNQQQRTPARRTAAAEERNR
jgi:hypothetical protein